MTNERGIGIDLKTGRWEDWRTHQSIDDRDPKVLIIRAQLRLMYLQEKCGWGLQREWDQLQLAIDALDKARKAIR